MQPNPNPNPNPKPTDCYETCCPLSPCFFLPGAGALVGKRTGIRAAMGDGAHSRGGDGPAGDPRGAGIGTPEAIQAVWSCHREIVTDCLIPPAFQIPDAS